MPLGSAIVVYGYPHLSSGRSFSPGAGVLKVYRRGRRVKSYDWTWMIRHNDRFLKRSVFLAGVAAFKSYKSSKFGNFAKVSTSRSTAETSVNCHIIEFSTLNTRIFVNRSADPKVVIWTVLRCSKMSNFFNTNYTTFHQGLPTYHD